MVTRKPRVHAHVNVEANEREFLNMYLTRKQKRQQLLTIAFSVLLLMVNLRKEQVEGKGLE